MSVLDTANIPCAVVLTLGNKVELYSKVVVVVVVVVGVFFFFFFFCLPTRTT